mmetsp:Transcript_39276/g.117406  ORF Transcript_39276/g.117406 Transcript_39276/m.117406 type:complete len:210 (+) Transcript_39276:227-856(+)
MPSISASRRPERRASMRWESCCRSSATSAASSGDSLLSCSRSCTPKCRAVGAEGRAKSKRSMSSRETPWPSNRRPATTSAGLALAARLPRLPPWLSVGPPDSGVSVTEDAARCPAAAAPVLACCAVALSCRSPSSISLRMSAESSWCRSISWTISSGRCASDSLLTRVTSISRCDETPKESARALTTASQPLRPSPPGRLDNGCSSWML